jgi:hypothetical protein
MDSQSVKAAETVGASSRGFDAGRRSTAVTGMSRLWPYPTDNPCTRVTFPDTHMADITVGSVVH